MKKINNQNGRSMIEMLGVLAIIGVLSVGGIAGYSKAMQKYRINKTIEQITLIAGNIRSFLAPQGNYDGVYDTDVLKKAKLVPNEMWNEGKTELYNVWDSRFVILAPNGKYSTSNTNDAFVFILLGIPQEACVELMTQDWNNLGGLINYGTMDDFVVTTFIDNCKENKEKARSDGFYIQCGGEGPMELNDAVTACEKDWTGGNHGVSSNIIFKFY